MGTKLGRLGTSGKGRIAAALALARPGGLIAIVLPEGVLANARRGPERQWLFAEHTVHAVVGLPRSTFRPAGITAKTCLCFIEKSPPAAGDSGL